MCPENKPVTAVICKELVGFYNVKHGSFVFDQLDCFSHNYNAELYV